MERSVLDILNSLLPLLFGSKFNSSIDRGFALLGLFLFRILCRFLCLCIFISFNASELCVSVHGAEHPRLLWSEILYLPLSVDNKCEGRSLHPSYRKHLFVLTVFDGVKTCCIHAEKPVANGTRETSEIQRVIFFLIFQIGKALSNGIFCQRTNPKTFHWAFCSCFLHHPSLYELTLLPGIATVYNFVSLFHELFND